jgi:hypothetical protein
MPKRRDRGKKKLAGRVLKGAAVAGAGVATVKVLRSRKGKTSAAKAPVQDIVANANVPVPGMQGVSVRKEALSAYRPRSKNLDSPNLAKRRNAKRVDRAFTKPEYPVSRGRGSGLTGEARRDYQRKVAQGYKEATAGSPARKTKAELKARRSKDVRTVRENNAQLDFPGGVYKKLRYGRGSGRTGRERAFYQRMVKAGWKRKTSQNPLRRKWSLYDMGEGMTAEFRRPRRDRGRKRGNRRAVLKGVAAGAALTGAVGGSLYLKKLKGKDFQLGRKLGNVEAMAKGAKEAFKDPVGTMDKVRAVEKIRNATDAVGATSKKATQKARAASEAGWSRDRRAKEALKRAPGNVKKMTKRAWRRGWERHNARIGKIQDRLRGKAGFSGTPQVISFRGGLSTAEFARKGKHLSRQHKAKISKSLKARNQTGRAAYKGQVLKLRQSEASARKVRNVGYLANAASQGVREARLTAKWLGVSPGRSRNGFSVRSARQYTGLARDIGSLLR